MVYYNSNMHMIPMLFIFIFYLCHQCYSADNHHHHAHDKPIHTSNFLLEDSNMLLNESFKSLSELENFHSYMKTFGGDICYGWNNTVKNQILILVDSDTEHEFQRQVARTTWLRNFQGAQSNVRVVFFIGKPHSLVSVERLIVENRKYGDIIWTHVPETSEHYKTFKIVSGLHWVLNRCKHAKFVLKVDVKSIINIPAVQNFVNLQQNYSNNTIWGFTHSFLNENNRKYYIYTCDKTYMMTDDTVKKLYFGALNKTYTSDENKFLTGFVADDQGVNLIHDKHFKALTLSSILPTKSTTKEKCDDLQNQMVFLKSDHGDEWAHIESSFKSCISVNASKI